MSPSSTSSVAAARLVWARALKEASSEEIAPTVARVHVLLREGLGRWIGAEGFRALSTRAIKLAEAEHPAFTLQTHDGEGETIASALRLHGKAQVTEALEEHLAAVIDLLGRIIGEDMAMQLVLRSTMVNVPDSLSETIEGGRSGH